MDEIIYIAGLFDGEGSCDIQVDFRSAKKADGHTERLIRFNPRMTLPLKRGYGDTQRAMDIMVKNLGGTVYNIKDRDMLRWSLGRIENLKICANRLLPYLIVKRGVATKFLNALDLFPSRKGVSSTKGDKIWTSDLCIQVATMAYDLNRHYGPAQGRFTRTLDDIIEEIKEIYG